MGGSCTFTRSRNMKRIVVVSSSSSSSSTGEVFEGVGRDFGFGGGFRATEVRFRGLRWRYKGEGNGGGGGGRVGF